MAGRSDLELGICLHPSSLERDLDIVNRVFYRSDYVGESVEEYIRLLQREIAYIKEGLGTDMEKLGHPSLNPEELEGLLSQNALRLWQLPS